MHSQSIDFLSSFIEFYSLNNILFSLFELRHDILGFFKNYNYVIYSNSF